MKIIICDDQIEEIREIRELCETYLTERELEAEVSWLTDPQALLDMETIDADILILDVEMGEMNGIEVKDRLAVRGDSPLVIFATSHPEAMSRAFNINVIGFLIKPLDMYAFSEYMDSAMNILTADWLIDYPDGAKGSTGDILWIEADQGYADAHLTDGSVRSLGKRSIKELSAWLEPVGFICISSGQMVNCKHIDDLTDGRILLEHVLTKPGAEPENVIFSISRRRKKDCWEKYVSYCEKTQKYI